MALVACVTFMLVKDQKILAEKRKRTKNVVPGAVALPGGHMEHGESWKTRYAANYMRNWALSLRIRPMCAPSCIDPENAARFITSPLSRGVVRCRIMKPKHSCGFRSTR